MSSVEVEQTDSPPSAESPIEKKITFELLDELLPDSPLEEAVNQIRGALVKIKDDFKKLNNFFSIISQRINNNFKETISCDFSDDSLALSAKYQMLKDEFLHNNPHIMNDIIPDKDKEELKEIFPSIFGKSTNSLISNPPPQDDLAEAWEFIWETLLNPDDKIKICLDIDVKVVDALAEAQDLAEQVSLEIYSTLPIYFRINLSKHFVQEYEQIKEEMTDLKAIQESFKQEEQKLLDSITYLSSTNFSKDVISERDLVFSAIQNNFTTEKTKIENQILEKETWLKEFQKTIRELKKANLGLPSGNKEDNLVSIFCPICYDARRSHALPCGHIFCITCITDNARLDYHDNFRVGNCPDCRKSYRSNDPTQPILKVFL